MRRSHLARIRRRQGVGAVSVLCLATVLLLGMVFASYTAAQLRFADRAHRSVVQAHASNHLADTASYLHSYDGAAAVSGNQHHLALVEEEPVRRCVIVGYLDETLMSKQYLLDGKDNANSLCNTSVLTSTVKQRYVLDGEVEAVRFRFLDAASQEVNPNHATVVVFELRDKATGLALAVRMPVNRR